MSLSASSTKVVGPISLPGAMIARLAERTLFDDVRRLIHLPAA
jgi:hypothetical protein